VKSTKEILQENSAAESIQIQKKTSFENCTAKSMKSHKESHAKLCSKQKKISQGRKSHNDHKIMKSHKKISFGNLVPAQKHETSQLQSMKSYEEVSYETYATNKHEIS
jgi:hypothetical protein